MPAASLGKRRTSILALGILVWAGVVVLQLFKVQVLEYSTYSGKIRAQTMRIMDLHSKRGTIYDRCGDILAISIQAQSAFISNKEPLASLRVYHAAAGILPLRALERQRIEHRIRRGDKFVWVRRKLSDGEYESLRPLAAAERGILGFITEYRRIYPQRRTASHILGGVGVDEQPLGGIELRLDAEIRGRGGRLRTLMDARKKVFQLRFLEEPVPGKDIVLTIDSGIQYIVEKELRRTVATYGARGGAVVVLDSRDGSVLAMASCPDYAPEEIGSARPEALRNRAISFLYDPGSTFKIVVAAAALENAVCYPRQVFHCFDGRYPVRDRVITDVHPYGQLTFEDVIVHSSNIGAARIGERLGSDRLYAAVRGFGFGSRSGIDLPGEEGGILNPRSRWTPVSLAYISHGYEIAVTPLQMARAINVIAAGGRLLRPELLARIAGRPCAAAPAESILTPATVQQLVQILAAVVERGTGGKARIEGLQIAGKTGTAQKVKAGAYSSDHISSFGGFFPAADPRVTIFVMIDEPQGDYYGGDVAAPLFRGISELLLAKLHVFPVPPAPAEVRP